MIIKSLVRYKMSENKSVSTHIISYIERLGKLGCQLDRQLVMNLVLDSLSHLNFLISSYMTWLE
jgi:hypothetical protein